MPKPNILECDALGTHWWITFDNITELELNRNRILTIINKFERSYSRFRETSLLAQLNNNKIISNPPKEFVDILLSSLDFYNKSSGLFNISVGSQLELEGYGRTKDSSSAITHTLNKDLTVSHSTVILSQTTRIDLGGIGKGWLIDKLASTLHNSAPSGFIINGGGDIYVALKAPTDLALEHPFDEKQYIGTINATQGALAVSSPLKRTWKHEGKSKTHIINPKSNTPVEYITSYVRAHTATIADVLATILLIANEQQRNQLTETFDCEYMLLRPDMTYEATPGFGAKLL